MNDFIFLINESEFKHLSRGAFYFEKRSDLMEKSYFFDSTEDDERIYQAADFARFHHQIIGNGVSNTQDLPDLEVTAKNNMEVALGSGYMFVNGYMYENTSSLTLTHDAPDVNNDRIDRIVIKFDSDPEKREIKAYIKKGTPASSPKPPTLTRDNYVYEMSVAQVRVIAGKSFVEDENITDERSNDDACGYIPLHNIYRGLDINELGMVTLPKQSYVKSENNITRNISAENDTKLIMETAQVDKQKELQVGVNNFVPRSDGTYHFWVQTTFLHSGPGSLEVGEGVVLYLYVNGVESFPLGAKIYSGTLDRYMTFSGVDELKKGDVVNFYYRSSNFSRSKTVVRTRLRIAKTS